MQRSAQRTAPAAAAPSTLAPAPVRSVTDGPPHAVQTATAPATPGHRPEAGPGPEPQSVARGRNPGADVPARDTFTPPDRQVGFPAPRTVPDGSATAPAVSVRPLLGAPLAARPAHATPLGPSASPSGARRGTAPGHPAPLPVVGAADARGPEAAHLSSPSPVAAPAPAPATVQRSTAHPLPASTRTPTVQRSAVPAVPLPVTPLRRAAGEPAETGHPPAPAFSAPAASTPPTTAPTAPTGPVPLPAKASESPALSGRSPQTPFHQVSATPLTAQPVRPVATPVHPPRPATAAPASAARGAVPPTHRPAVQRRTGPAAVPLRRTAPGATALPLARPRPATDGATQAPSPTAPAQPIPPFAPAPPAPPAPPVLPSASAAPALPTLPVPSALPVLPTPPTPSALPAPSAPAVQRALSSAPPSPPRTGSRVSSQGSPPPPPHIPATPPPAYDSGGRPPADHTVREAGFDPRTLTDFQLDELTHRLTGRITRLLRTELRLDRERIGRLRDPRT
ncbi:hypothetical protein [Streptomyces sp. NPDC054863]